MTVQAFNVGDELRRIVDEGQISEEALLAITGISPHALHSFLTTSQGVEQGMSASPAALSEDEVARLSMLAVQLTAGAEIDDDERLQAIIETLMTQFNLTRENVALLTRTRLEDLDIFLTAPEALPLEKKWQLAIRSYYLFSTATNAAARPA